MEPVIQRHKDSVLIAPHVNDGKAHVFYRFNHPAFGPMTIRCTPEQLVAAINYHLPSNPERLARHFDESAGPIGNLIYAASDLSDEDIADYNDIPGKVIG